MKRGTYSEFLKSRVDILSLFDNGNKQSEPSPVPGTPTVISESLVQSLQSPRPSVKDAAPEDQDVSFSPCSVPGLCALGGLRDLQSALLMSSFVPK